MMVFEGFDGLMFLWWCWSSDLGVALRGMFGFG